MSHYFVSSRDLSDIGVDVDTLTFNKIPFSIDEREGLLIDNEDIVRDIASSVDRTFTVSPTNYDHIYRVTFSDQGEVLVQEEIPVIDIPEPDLDDIEDVESIFKVNIHDNWDGYHQAGFKDIITKKLLRIVNRDILLSVPHGFSSDRLSEDNFEIHIWSSIEGERSKTVPQKLYGIPVSCRDKGFEKSSRDDCIRYESGGWVLAELFPNTLYIHHDICHKGTDDELRLFEKLIDLVKDQLETPELRTELIRAEQKRSSENFVKICQKSIIQRLQKAEKKLEEIHEEIDTFKSKLVSSLRYRETLDEEIKTLTPSITINKDKFNQQFQQLMKIEDVLKVRIPNEEQILVYTNMLTCTDPRTDIVHAIGKFKITIDVKGHNGAVKWNNLTQIVKNAYNSEGMQAPHVYLSGKACLGNVEESFLEYLASYDFYTLAILAIKFIQSVNINDSAGTHIEKWPVYKPEEIKES